MIFFREIDNINEEKLTWAGGEVVKRVPLKAGWLMPYMWYTYIIKSLKLGTCYIGSTGNFKQRLIKHNSGATTYTKNKGPWALVFLESFLRKKKQS